MRGDAIPPFADCPGRPQGTAFVHRIRCHCRAILLIAAARSGLTFNAVGAEVRMKDEVTSGPIRFCVLQYFASVGDRDPSDRPTIIALVTSSRDVEVAIRVH